MSFLPNRSPLSSWESLLHCSAVWPGQCNPHSAVAAPTVWRWEWSQLHHHWHSRLQSSHHQWNKCSSYCALQCETHCQYCSHQLQWEQQCCHGDNWNRYVVQFKSGRYTVICFCVRLTTRPWLKIRQMTLAIHKLSPPVFVRARQA